MNEDDVIDLLGEPDRVLPAGGGMTSNAWECLKCSTLTTYDTLVKIPAPCSVCGGISFLKRARTQH